MSRDFQALLDETGVAFTQPNEFVRCATRENSEFAYFVSTVDLDEEMMVRKYNKLR